MVPDGAKMRAMYVLNVFKQSITKIYQQIGQRKTVSLLDFEVVYFFNVKPTRLTRLTGLKKAFPCRMSMSNLFSVHKLKCRSTAACQKIDGSAVRAQTNRQTDGQMLPSALSPSLRGQ